MRACNVTGVRGVYSWRVWCNRTGHGGFVSDLLYVTDTGSSYWSEGLDTTLAGVLVLFPLLFGVMFVVGFIFIIVLIRILLVRRWMVMRLLILSI